MPNLTACLVRLSEKDGALSCRIALDNVKNAIPEGWRNKESERLGATLKTEENDETLYATLTFSDKGVQK